MQGGRQQRRALRRDYAVTVRLRCDRCERVVGTLHGTHDEPQEFSSGPTAGVLPRGGRVDYFRCHPRCGADYEVRSDKLAAAYRKAASRPAEQARVVWLLADVH